MDYNKQEHRHSILNVPDSITRFSWKHILNKHPFASISEADFVRLAIKSEGWKLVSTEGRRYNIKTGFANVDHFVKEALWHFDEELYESLRGHTKTPVPGRAYHSLLKYCGPVRYRKELLDNIMTPIYNEQIEKLSGMFQWVQPIDINVICDPTNLKIPTSTSAGYNFPGLTKQEALPLAIKNVQAMIHEWSQGRQVAQIPNKLAFRGHLSPVDEVKTRCIWVAPIENVIIENMIFRGFYSQISSAAHLQNFFMTGRGTMSRLNDYLDANKEDSFVNTDISGWDAMRVRFVLMDVFNRVLKPRMKFTEQWQEMAFEYCIESFVFTFLALPGGTIIQKLSGVPSGSFLTLLINSLAMHLIMVSCVKYLGADYYDSRVLGDDFCYKLGHLNDEDLELHVVDLIDCVSEYFCLEVKLKKVIYTNNVKDRKFIGYQIRNGKIFREDRDLLLGMLHPETEVEDLAKSFTRVFSFMVIGGFNSALVTRFFERYLGGYYEELKKFGGSVFNRAIALNGNLRVFKHVFHVDLDSFIDLTIDDFLKLYADKVPFFLTFGARYLFT